MNNKKNLRPQKLIPVSSNPDDDPDQAAASQRLLQNIQQKLNKSAVLNGGFDRLFYKIDSIEANQTAIASKVDKIHEAIYDPDEGLFARITNNKALQNESIADVEKQVGELNVWKEQKEKSIEDVEEKSEKINEKIVNIENTIDNLNHFKGITIGTAKWFLAAVGGGVATIVFKVLYDFVIIK